MKKTRSFIMAFVMVFASLINVSAQTADELIQKHLDAVGGVDNWKKINSLKMTGSMNAGGQEIPITMTTVNGKASRMDIVINGMANYTILTTTEGWAYFPIQGQTKPEAFPAEMVKEQQDELDVTMDPLIDYKAKETKVAYLGKDDVEGTECHKFKVTLKNGKEQTLFLDAGNYYCLRSVEKTKANGKEVESATVFGNFQKLPEGIVFPMSISSDFGPLTLKSVEINKPVDESIFKLPEDKK